MQLPVTIPLRPSRRMSLLLVLAHIVALAVAWPLTLPLSYKALLAAAIVASALVLVRRARYPAVAALHLNHGGKLEIETRVGARDTAIVLPQTTVLPGLIVLLLRRGGRTIALPLPADATGDRPHRQLRLWLKWQTASN